MSEPELRFGTGVWVYKGDLLLVGRRKSIHGDNTWCPPGGHLEPNEAISECAKREVREESAVEIEELEDLGIEVADLNTELNAFYRTTFYRAAWKAGEPVVLPSEYYEWRWARWEEMPQPLFRPARLFVEQYGNPLEIK